MAKIETTIQEIKNGGVLLEEYLNEELQNGESTLILKEGVLYKIIEAIYRKEKQAIIELLHDTKLDIPIHLYNLYYENGHFFCYSMEYYVLYPTLNEVLKSDISLKERKIISLELIHIYQKLFYNKIIYFDWHSKNCMYKKGIKLLDVDSAKITTSSYYDAIGRRNLFWLCLAILLAVDFDYDLCLDESEKENVVEAEEMFLSRTIPLDFAFMEKEIMSYTTTKVECKRERILKRNEY